MAAKEFIVAIELGSSKMTGIAGQKNLDGSIQVLAVVKENSSAFIRKGVVYNIDKTAQCLTSIVRKLEAQLKTEIRQVYVGVGGQSIRSVKNVIAKDLPNESIITQDMVIELMDANRNMVYPDQEILDAAVQEYKVGSQLQLDPVGIQANHLEGNFLNILERGAFYRNLNKCFEAAGINILRNDISATGICYLAQRCDVRLSPRYHWQQQGQEEEQGAEYVGVFLHIVCCSISFFYCHLLSNIVVPCRLSNRWV